MEMNNWIFIFQHLRLIIGGEGYQKNRLSLPKKWKRRGCGGKTIIEHSWVSKRIYVARKNITGNVKQTSCLRRVICYELLFAIMAQKKLPRWLRNICKTKCVLGEYCSIPWGSAIYPCRSATFSKVAANHRSLRKKWNFPLRISSINFFNKCHTYWRNP